MISFIICLVFLVAAYFVYGKFIERKFENSAPEHCTPSKDLRDNVDYVPMSAVKTFLIQLLNIAGLGPIFGAIMGATFGPIAFLWITLGGVFIGAVHDYAIGMISFYNKGISLPEIIGKYLGKSTKHVMCFVTLLLLVMVGVVFVTGPAALLFQTTGISQNIWFGVIITYYIIATIFPIDKIIGSIYPIFSIALLSMALMILAMIFIDNYSIPEVTFESLRNMKSNTDKFPIMPMLFVTIACGAVSGFHGTQSPMMSRCIKNSKHGRITFFGAMISESIIALVWAAIAMSFFGDVDGLQNQLDAVKGNAAPIVDTISKGTLGTIGGFLAILGVIIAPITSGDTAYRSARLIIADFTKIDQRNLFKRILTVLPVFVVAFFVSQIDFDIIWRYFAWGNQLLAVFSLICIDAYLISRGKRYAFIYLPAMFMIVVVASYILGPNGASFSNNTAIAISVVMAIIYFVLSEIKSRASRTKE